MEIEDKLILAKLMDKIKICKTKNKIVNSEFLTIYQKSVIEKELKKIKFSNYFFFGGYEEAEGECLIIYPEKLEIEIVKKYLENIVKAIKITLPKELKGKYSHRDYLSAAMHTGLNRNRIGDIIVHQKQAYIVVLNENSKYIADALKNMTRFNKSEIEIVNFDQIEVKVQEFEEMKLSLSSMRLDNVVSEIAKISRSKAENFLNSEKIFVNSKCEVKGTKIIKEDDIVVIRGNGKFIIDEVVGVNKKEKIIVKVKKYK